MSLLGKLRRARLKSKAEIKAAKARAKKEAKEAVKLEYKRDKLLAKQEKALLKAERKGLKKKHKHEHKIAKKELEKLKEQRFDAGSARRLAGGLRVLLPVVLPLIYRGITMAREKLVQNRADKLGVSPDQVVRFSGHGAPVKARIAAISDKVHEADLPSGFVLDADNRLKELDAAVDNAEFMTTEQRRRAHQSINSDLDQLLQEVNTKQRG